MALARVRDQSPATLAALRVVAAAYVSVAAGWFLVQRGAAPVVLVGLVTLGALAGALAGTVASTARSDAVPLAWRAPAVGVGVVAVVVLSATAGWISLLAACVVVATVAAAVVTVIGCAWPRSSGA